MFIRFFQDLRRAGVPVTLKEFLTLLEAITQVGHGLGVGDGAEEEPQVGPERERVVVESEVILEHASTCRKLGSFGREHGDPLKNIG